MEYGYNINQELNPGRADMARRIKAGLDSNPQAAQQMVPQIETQIVGSPLSPAERAEVAPTAAGAAAIAVDKQLGLSPRDSILKSINERQTQIAQEKMKLYDAEATGKPLTRGQQVALAMLAMAPLLGRALGGNMGGVAGGEGALLASKLMLGTDARRQEREERRADANAELLDRENLALEKSKLDMQTLPYKEQLKQDAILNRHKTERELGIGNQGTNVNIKVDTEGAKGIVKNQIEAEQGYKSVANGADAIIQTISELKKSGELPPQENLIQAAWRDARGKVLKGSSGDMLRREQTKILISQLRKQMGGNPSDYDTKVMNYVTGMDFGVPVQVIEYLAKRAKFLAYQNAMASSTSDVVDTSTGQPIQTTRLDIKNPPEDPLAGGMFDSYVRPAMEGKLGTPNPAYRKKAQEIDSIDTEIAAKKARLAAMRGGE